MTEHHIPGSGNSLVGSRDDGYPTNTELIRCKHCLEPMSFEDAMDEVCNSCVAKERLEWSCNDCDQIWLCAGIPIHCPACDGLNIDSLNSSRLDNLRAKVIKSYVEKFGLPKSSDSENVPQGHCLCRKCEEIKIDASDDGEQICEECIVNMRSNAMEIDPN